MATNSGASAGSVALAFLSGALLGAVTAVMLAPQPGRESRERLTGYVTPTILIAGDQDQVFDFEALHEVAGMIPGTTFHAVPGVGHSPYFEVPETFNRSGST